MTSFTASLATQFGAGMFAFFVSAACILSAIPPMHLVG